MATIIKSFTELVPGHVYSTEVINHSKDGKITAGIARHLYIGCENDIAAMVSLDAPMPVVVRIKTQDLEHNIIELNKVGRGLSDLGEGADYITVYKDKLERELDHCQQICEAHRILSDMAVGHTPKFDSMASERISVSKLIKMLLDVQTNKSCLCDVNVFPSSTPGKVVFNFVKSGDRPDAHTIDSFTL